MKSTELSDKDINHILLSPKRALLLRLTAVWIIVTVIGVGATVLFGFNRINEHIVSILKADSEESIDLFKDLKETESSQIRFKLENEIKKLLNNDFVNIRLYNENMQNIMDLSRDNNQKKIRQITDQISDMFSDHMKPISKRFASDGKEYIFLMAPILDKGINTIGYFKATYQINEAMLTGLRKLILLITIIIGVIILSTLLIVYPIVIRLNKGLADTSRELLASNIGMLKTLGSAIAKRDNDTSLHNYRVTISSIVFAESVGLNNMEIKRLIIGALLHDIGKIGTPDSILLKPDRLNDDEFIIMSDHVNNGLDIISQYKWLSSGADIVGCHHEKFDGSGYPNSIGQYDIPVTARIFAIIDVFDALISKRPYKRAFTYEESIRIMADKAGNHFDPALMKSFLKISQDLYDLCTEIDETKADIEFDRIVKKYFPEMKTKKKKSGKETQEPIL